MSTKPQVTAQLCVLLALTCHALTLPYSDSRELRTFALEDLLPPRKEFAKERIVGQWISETDFIFVDPEGGIKRYNGDTNCTGIFLTEDAMKNLNHSVASFSHDGRYLLLSSDAKKVYRWSSTAKYYVYEVESGSIWPVDSGRHVQTCVWSTGASAALAFVRDNNVYYAPDVTDASDVRQLTRGGLPGEVSNGVADWIYEEEILSSADAMWFSTKGSYLAVATFNDTLVESASYQYYGAPANVNFQYPVMVRFKYPKVGRTNPTVTLRVYPLQGTWGERKPPTLIPAPEDVVGADHVLGSVRWASDQHVVVLWLNRRQNTSVLLRCDMENDECEIKRVHNEPNGWIDLSEASFDESGTRMVDITPQPTGSDRHPHAVLTDFVSKTTVDLSPGNVTVTSILGWNSETDAVYYMAAPREVPWERQLWVAREGGTRCVTCGEAACKIADARFAPGAAHALVMCSATNVPTHTFMYNAQTDQLTLWQDNGALAAELSHYALPPAQHSVLQLRPGVTAHARLLLPPDLDTSRPHPMLLYVYAGPGSARVLDKYDLDYSTYLASNRSFIVCFVDVRGSGVMGSNALHAVNNALGTVEVDDTLEVIRHLVKKHSFIDRSRVGVWGWSYGGYTAALMLAHDRDHLLRCAAAVAPVTSWLYYDSIYTERYMGVPSENQAGYERSDLLLQAKKLRGRKLLLVHGNADDNVHYQHSIMLSKMLQHADIAFEQMSYPDENHSLAGVSRHFYHTLDRYWTECFE